MITPSTPDIDADNMWCIPCGKWIDRADYFEYSHSGSRPDAQHLDCKLFQWDTTRECDNCSTDYRHVRGIADEMRRYDPRQLCTFCYDDIIRCCDNCDCVSSIVSSGGFECDECGTFYHLKCDRFEKTEHGSIICRRCVYNVQSR